MQISAAPHALLRYELSPLTWRQQFGENGLFAELVFVESFWLSGRSRKKAIPRTRSELHAALACNPPDDERQTIHTLLTGLESRK